LWGESQDFECNHVTDVALSSSFTLTPFFLFFSFLLYIHQVPMESDIDYAIEELERLQFRLERHVASTNLDSSHKQQNGTPAATPSEQDIPMPNDLLQPVTLMATIDPTKGPVSFQSTFGRELWFCSLHAVRITHHASLILALLTRQSIMRLFFFPLHTVKLLNS
jgi:hypothetical protein